MDILSRISIALLIVPTLLGAAPACSGAPAASTLSAQAKKTAPKANAETCTTAQRWALACPALLAVGNGHRHDILTGAPRTAENIASEKQLLSQWWNVGSRKDLLDQLTWLTKEGHRSDFEEMRKLSASPVELAKARSKLAPSSRADFESRIDIVRAEAPLLGPKSLLGWDYCRYIALCRWGTMAGYLSPDEAWAKIMPVARMLQKTFPSWAELGRNYLVGRQFWQPSQPNNRAFEANYIRLMSDSKSPWNSIPWNTDLSGSPSKRGS